jgi:hypothetical protein
MVLMVNHSGGGIPVLYLEPISVNVNFRLIVLTVKWEKSQKIGSKYRSTLEMPLNDPAPPAKKKLRGQSEDSHMSAALSPDGARSRERTPVRAAAPAGERSERVKKLLGRMAATEEEEQMVRTTPFSGGRPG